MNVPSNKALPLEETTELLTAVYKITREVSQALKVNDLDRVSALLEKRETLMRKLDSDFSRNALELINQGNEKSNVKNLINLIVELDKQNLEALKHRMDSTSEALNMITNQKKA